jgi:hypothetical protein
MTSGGFEWTGLAADNKLLEPLNRRGPRPLPLKEGEVDYQRAIDFGGDHSFGFYRDRTQTAAKIRNVVMTGDWPETLPADVLENPTVTTDLVVK